MRFFTGLSLGFSVGIVFAFPILALMSASVARLFRIIGLPHISDYLQSLILFVIVYSVFAVCAIRVVKVTNVEAFLLGFLLVFPVVSLTILVAAAIGDPAID